MNTSLLKVNDDKTVMLILVSRNNQKKHNTTMIKISDFDIIPSPSAYMESDVDDSDNDPTYETGSGDHEDNDPTYETGTGYLEDATDDSTPEEEVAPEKKLPHIHGGEHGVKGTRKRKFNPKSWKKNMRKNLKSTGKHTLIATGERKEVEHPNHLTARSVVTSVMKGSLKKVGPGYVQNTGSWEIILVRRISCCPIQHMFISSESMQGVNGSEGSCPVQHMMISSLSYRTEK